MLRVQSNTSFGRMMLGLGFRLGVDSQGSRVFGERAAAWSKAGKKVQEQFCGEATKLLVECEGVLLGAFRHRAEEEMAYSLCIWPGDSDEMLHIESEFAWIIHVCLPRNFARAMTANPLPLNRI